jgi:ubiquinone/menaquinone biosynthesis C-methylase UbiE
MRALLVVMSTLPPGWQSVEEERIRSVYRRRPEAGLYTCFNPAFLFHVQERERGVLSCLMRQGFTELTSKTILDLGCGAGFWIREFIKWGARPENISGIEIIPERLARARETCPPRVTLAHANAADIQARDESFDIVLQSTVFTSVVDPAIKRRIASEMLRVLKPDGLILWYDFHMNNPRNRDVRGVKKREIRELFAGCRIDLRRTTLAPPLARAIAPYSWLAYYLLARIPFLNTHYLGVIRKR